MPSANKAYEIKGANVKVIFNQKLYKEIWDRIHNDFGFFPASFINQTIKSKIKYRAYKLKSYWTEQEEKIVNSIFIEMSADDIYALDWQHDCFIFNPREEIPLYYHYYDKDRDCNVYFPSYLPDGDYHFFISKDWSYGLLGHPWRKEIYVFGNELIKKFEDKMNELHIEKLKKY